MQDSSSDESSNPLLDILMKYKHISPVTVNFEEIVSGLDHLRGEKSQLIKELVKIDKLSHNDDLCVGFGEVGLLGKLIGMYRDFYDEDVPYVEDDLGTEIRVEIVSILNNFSNNEKYHAEMWDNGIMNIIVDQMDALPASLERKGLMRIFSIISENVWYREPTLDILAKKFPYKIDEESPIWKKMDAEKYDPGELEYFLDGLRCLDLCLDKYQKGGRAFYNPQDFEICRVLEANYEIIREEMLAIKNQDLVSYFDAYSFLVKLARRVFVQRRMGGAWVICV
eukprot:TRINITY_DN4214_c0_g1_i2.p1 TRINITY_DN4214_c0_g1~~TRINITY_DN4214_c0_g1_i2.p1  ORF type:complete len:281 (+),score=68.86 TRINITY_DN4214_c0_g1_i2:33-875(+)